MNHIPNKPSRSVRKFGKHPNKAQRKMKMQARLKR